MIVCFLLYYLLAVLQSCVSKNIQGRCSIYEKRMDCSRRHISGVPKSTKADVEMLDLSHNVIKSLENGIFKQMEWLQILDISYNNISKMEIGAFLGLRHLKVLNLSHNKLNMPMDFPLGIFEPLKDLEVLKIHGTINGGAYPELALQDLSSLQELHLQGTSQNFGTAFAHLTNLTSLFLGAPNCGITHLSEETFSVFNNLNIQELSIQGCDSLFRVELDAFKYFPMLKTLNLACNYLLTPHAVLNAVFRIPGQPLETLVLDGINRFTLQDLRFSRYTICPGKLPTYNLKRLSIRHTNLVYSSFDVLACLPALEVVNIAFNPMNDINAPWKVFSEETRQFWMNSNITELDWSYGFSPFETAFMLQYCVNDILPTRHFFKNYQLKYGNDLVDVESPEINLPDTFEMKLNPKVQILHIDNLNTLLPSTLSLFCLFHFSSNNDIRFMNVSHNRFGDFTCEMKGLHHVQEIDMSHCGYTIASKIAFRSMPNLRRLILAGNELGTNEQQLNDSFDFLTKLDSIVLSNNKIKHLPKKNIFFDEKYF